MCGQFELSTETVSAPAYSAWARRYVGSAALSVCRLEGIIHPGDVLPVLARGRSGKPGVFLMRWGYQMEAASRPLLINARSETAAAKPLFSPSFSARRCLIPAARYFEWQRNGGRERRKFSLMPENGCPAYLAGLYRYEADRLLPSFVVLTRPAESDIAFIHRRMPVLLSGNAARQWLEADANPQALLNQALRTMQIRQAEDGQGDEPPEDWFD